MHSVDVLCLPYCLGEFWDLEYFRWNNILSNWLSLNACYPTILIAGAITCISRKYERIISLRRRAYAEIRVARWPSGKEARRGSKKKAKKRQKRYRGQENAKYCKKVENNPEIYCYKMLEIQYNSLSP